jgi:hypothetical protein
VTCDLGAAYQVSILRGISHPNLFTSGLLEFHYVMASQGNAVPALETTAASNDNTSGNVNRFSAPDQVNSANDELPSMSIQRKVENHTVLDHNGKTHPFKSLYSGPDAACRVLVIFVRHFFCGVSFFNI